MIEHVLLTLALLGIALLFGATAYESVVMAPNYEREIPGSIDLARQFLSRVTPAHFFRVLTPVTQLLLLGGVIAGWNAPTARWAALFALGVLVLLDVITFTFHYPRLAIMFKTATPQDPAVLERAAREWAAGNVVRFCLLLLALLGALHGLVQGHDGL